MAKQKLPFSSLEKDNAKVLAELVVDPSTPEHQRVQILNKLLDSTEADDFFGTIFNEKLSFGACPDCGHENHWLIPEENLGKMGYVSHEVDPRVSRMTTKEICNKYEEACSKKKIGLT